MPSPLIQPPRVYAHRGGAALRPENTLAAFEHALSLGAQGLELDVHLSRDGIVVVHHDETLERTTSGRGPVAGRTADDLAALDAGYWFQPPGAGPGEYPFRGLGLGVPRLAEVLARHRDCELIIEMKVDRPELARRVIDAVRDADAVDRTALGSFYGGVLRAARACDPRIRTGAAQEETRWALYRSRVRWPLWGRAYQEFQVPERSGRTTIVTPRFVAAAHRARVPVKVWTVDAPADMERLLDWGVDALITDRPDVAVAVVSRRGNSRVGPGVSA